MAEFDNFSAFWKAAPRRLADAEELLEQPTRDPNSAGADLRHLRGAMYLAGYAVECALKAYLIANTMSIARQQSPVSIRDVLVLRRSRGQDAPDLLGAKGHDIALLARLASLDRHYNPDDDVAIAVATCSKWRHTMRYDPSVPEPAKARQLVSAARTLHDWIRARTAGGSD